MTSNNEKRFDKSEKHDKILLDSEVVSFIPDFEFAYIGFTAKQIDRLRDEPNDLRRMIYDEGIKRLMESAPGDHTNMDLRII